MLEGVHNCLCSAHNLINPILPKQSKLVHLAFILPDLTLSLVKVFIIIKTGFVHLIIV